MQIKNAKHLFERLLSLTSNAELQMTKSLPRLAEAADHKALVKAFESHLEETQGQLDRLEKAAEKIEGTRLMQLKDDPMATLIQDSDAIVENTEKGPVRDFALIGAARKIEHYEIAAYGTLRSLAKQLGYSEVRDILKVTLEEEEAADEKLKKLANKKIELTAD